MQLDKTDKDIATDLVNGGFIRGIVTACLDKQQAKQKVMVRK